MNSDHLTYCIILKNRLNSCIARYKGLEEYMEIPDMDNWLKIKEEIMNNCITKKLVIKQEMREQYDYDEYDKNERRMNKFIDKFTSRRSNKFDR